MPLAIPVAGVMSQRKGRASRDVAPRRAEDGDVNRAYGYASITQYIFFIVSFFVLIFCKDMEDRD